MPRLPEVSKGMGLRNLVRKLEAREHLKRIAKSHKFHTTHEITHMIYLVSIAAERGGFHSVTAGVLLVCAVVVMLGDEVEDHYTQL